MPALSNFWNAANASQWLNVAVWAGGVAATLVLIVALRKRWKHFSPLHRCTIVSVWFHALLVLYATSIQIVGERQGPGSGSGRVTIRLSAATAEATPQPAPTASDPTIPKTMTLAAARRTPPPSIAKPPVAKPPVEQRPIAPTPPAPLPPPPTAQPSPQPAVARPRVAAEARPAVTSPSPTPPQFRQVPTTTMPAAARASVNDALVRWSKPTTPTRLPDAAALLPSLAAPPTPPRVDAPAATVAPPAVALESAPLTPITIPPAATAMPAAPPAPSAIAVPAASPPAVAPPPAVVAPVPVQLQPHALPPLYQQRTAEDRDRIAALHGGSKQTEEAVRRALRWLALNQEPDGRWDASRFGSGRETQTLGQHRSGAGTNADTAMTGLALLALLGSGHTHQRGDFQTTVGRGLDFLAASQHPDGNVAGAAEPFAFMYSHGMATLALSETLAMTGDERLRPIVERAVGYTLRAQNPVTGGWRYRPGDTGDMSQLGWQLMTLKSAELAGVAFPVDTRRGIERFTHSVSSGPAGGLGSYRPGERPSRPMTAEALVCRQFLGTPRQTPALDEAGNYLLGELPGTGQANYYYWYYGTLGMYQLQGEPWRRWNDALTRQLLGTQNMHGDSAGSWDPTDVWGGYGGRVYSTALAALCLEVYYRYLPLYVEAASNGGDVQR